MDATTRGKLRKTIRFILDPRVVYLRKKNSAVPRPIRAGELWRRVVAKRIIPEDQTDISKTCENARQFGVGFHGGVNVLAPFRLVLEEVIRSGNIDHVVLL